MKNDLINKMVYKCDCNNFQELLFMKQEIIKLSDDLKRIKEEKNRKEQRIDDIRTACSDAFLVKITETCGDVKEINYYCLLCEKKVSSDLEFVNQDERYVVDFSDFTYDEGNLTITNKLEIVFELIKDIKESNPKTSNEEVVNYVNESIKIEDDIVKEKVMRKLLESLSVFPKRKVLY